ncbi:MAG: AbrB/MazE/SpoVT family DNA-binding domain-containing protein [Candidatus Hydrothermarchaeales archaeon]
MEKTVSVDEQGRIYLPKSIRDKVQIESGAILDVSVKDRKIILGPHKSIVRESKGIFRTKKPIEDIDRLAEEATYEEVAKDL